MAKKVKAKKAASKPAKKAAPKAKDKAPALTMKGLLETRRTELVKMAKKMGIKVDGPPPHTELVAKIAEKKGIV